MQLRNEPPVLGAGPMVPGGEENDTEAKDEAPKPAIAEGWSAEAWAQAAGRAMTGSTTWFDASVRPTVQRNYAHFASRHAPGSKYFHEYYRLRSQVFRPKTRSMMRRTEAAMAVALFSTVDLIETDPWNDGNPDQKDAAEIAKWLIQYRLEHSIPWYQTAVGAVQDAGITGRVIACLQWRFKRRKNKIVQTDGVKASQGEEEQVIEDRPIIDLRPLENVRIDPAADWRDPGNSSPYLIDMIPMYVGDVKQMIEDSNAEYGGTWYYGQDDASWWTLSKRDYDSVRAARQGSQVDPMQTQRGDPDNEIVWIHRVFMRRNGIDYTFDMVDTRRLLSIPRPTLEVYPHLEEGTRPYVFGTSAIEAHKCYPTSPVGMVEESQREINELANLRIDAIRLATLNRWLMRRGSNIDMETLKYGAANSVIVTENINQDVRELRSQEVGQSAFAEADRVSNEFDELGGHFSGSSVASQRTLNQTVGGMNLLSGDAGQVKEYEIRTLVETFVEPVVNMLYAMEQFYETDEHLLTEICTRTNLDVRRVLDLLSLRLKVRVNVGFNATSPEKRIQRLTMGVDTVTKLTQEAQALGLNTGEVIKEVFGALGYKDGARFFGSKPGEDPQIGALKQQVAQLQQQLQGKTIETQGKIEVAKVNAQAKLQAASLDATSRERVAILQAQIKAKELGLAEIDRQLAMEDADARQIELSLEREALSHSIQMDQNELMLKLTGVAHGVDLTKPPVTGGEDKAGTIGRGDYGLIPFEGG